MFGRVSGYAPDDDWCHTLRAEQARIVGPLYLRAGLPARQLTEVYDVPVRTGELPALQPLDSLTGCLNGAGG